MSQDLERETTASTSWSLVGALLGLGAGFLFLFLAMVTVATKHSATLASRDSVSHPLRASLHKDMLAAVPGSVAVTDEGRKLRFFIKQSDKGQQLKVIYLVKSVETGVVVTRQVYGTGDEAANVAHPRKAKFNLNGGVLRATWSTASGSEKGFWAVNRWPRRKV